MSRRAGTIVQSVIDDNPFECVSYMTGGVTHDPVEKTKEAYTAKFVYQDVEAKTVGTGSHKFDTLAKFNAGVTAFTEILERNIHKNKDRNTEY